MSTFPIPTDAMGITFLKGIRDCIAVMGEALLYQAGGATGAPIALNGVWTEDTGVQASRPGAQASVYLCLPDMPADPAKGDVVVHNETGILVKHPSVENLLIAIDRLVADRAEREALGQAGRKRVLNRFTLLHQADAWVDCLKGIC